MLVNFLGLHFFFLLTRGWKSLLCSICWTSPWFLMLLVLQFIPKRQKCNANTPNSDQIHMNSPTSSLLMVWIIDHSDLSISCARKGKLCSLKNFLARTQWHLFRLLTSPYVITHIITELSLFAKHILLLAIICTTAVPRGRDALHEVHEKNIYVWSSLSHSATIWLSQTCKD